MLWMNHHNLTLRVGRASYSAEKTRVTAGQRSRLCGGLSHLDLAKAAVSCRDCPVP